MTTGDGGENAVTKAPAVMIKLAIICALVGSTMANNEGCSIPEKWNGEWFISDLYSPTLVDSSSGFIKRHDDRPDYWKRVLGQCILNRGDYFIFRDPMNKCSKCVVLVEKHENVLYSTEAIECLMDTQWDQDNIETICNRLHGRHASNYYYWFRKDYKPIDCPFRNSSYRFSYRTPNWRKCESPTSHSSTCLDRSTTELEYQACHDHDQSEKKVEIMTCIARFDRQSDGEYLVADVTSSIYRVTRPLRDRFRCFWVQEKTIQNSVPSKPAVVTGYHIEVSEGPTCNGLLQSPEAGDTVLYFERNQDNIEDENTKLCSFPSWLTSQTWQSFGRSIEFKTDAGNTTIHIIPRNSNGDQMKGKDRVMQRRQSFFPLTRSQLQCLHKMNQSEESASSDDDHFVFVGKYTVDCKIDYICLHFVRRSDSIFQFYYEPKEPTLSQEEFQQRCFNASLPSLSKGVTMFNPDNFNGETCPTQLQGKYVFKNWTFEDNFTITDDEVKKSLLHFLFGLNRVKLEVGCSSPYQIDVVDGVTYKNNTLHLNCSSLRWEADDVQYLLLSFVIPSETEPYFICLAQSNKSKEIIGEGKNKARPAIFLSTKDCLNLNPDRFDDDLGALKGEESGNSNVNSYEGRMKMEKSAGCPSISVVKGEEEHKEEAPPSISPDTSSTNSFNWETLAHILIFLGLLACYVFIAWLKHCLSQYLS